MTAGEILKTYWGYDSFRPMQEEIISTAMAGNDVLAILPTGGGKSVCFQVPALSCDGIAIVVTPLIALMKDQVQNLASRGIKALCVHAGMNRHEVSVALNNAAYGDFKFLYVSPERLSTDAFRSYLEFMNVNYIVVDEAHCISQWGYDFRPDYLQIGELRKSCDAPLIALTATATPEVAADIMEKLSRDGKGGGMTLLRSGFERPNLSYVVRQCEDKTGQLLEICRSVNGSGIVYMRHRRKCEETAALLSASGISASFYHAGLSSRVRSERQEAWKAGKTQVMVCTNAFGMGIDKPDVRFVVHLELCDSLEAYFQEAGRAGRDGKRSYAVMLWNRRDVERLDKVLSVSFPSLDFIEDIYQKIHIFSGIPYDNGEGWSVKFDVEDFCRHYALNRSQVFYALKYLEKSGHLTYCEELDTPTMVRILVDREALYGIELPDAGMVTLLEQLMRHHTGVFSQNVPVDDEYLARAIGENVSRMHQLLYGLSLEHVIRYIPEAHSSIIFLHHNRLMPGNVDLQPARYEFLKSNAKKRAEGMIGYVSRNTMCRSRYLLGYFGQKDTTDCGCCDFCKSSATEARKKLMTFLNANGGATLAEIKAFVDNPANGMPPDSMEIYRSMLDKGDF